MNFVHLRSKSFYSMSEGMMSTELLVKKASDEKGQAIALTDLNKTCGIVEFQQAAKKQSIKPIVGAEISFESEISSQIKGFSNKMILIAESPLGYANINKILSRASLERTSGEVLCKEAWLSSMSTEDVICLSGFENSDLGQLLKRGKTQEAIDLVDYLSSVFPNRYFLEVQRDGTDDFESLTRAIISISQKTSIPIVATHPNLFEKESDYLANELKNCIALGGFINDITRQPIGKPSHRYMTAQEMIEAFKDMPEAIENTAEVAKLCNFDMKTGHNTLPEFVSGGQSTESKMLSDLSNKGLKQRLQKIFPVESVRQDNQDLYQARLDEEIKIIEKMGFPGYFLIVQDFIAWSKKNQVPIGPGRGSGAGSLVAYSLGITDIDPIENDLLFERFLNPERVSMPDFDIDICGVKRDQVIDYMRSRYGAEKVAQIGSYATLASKSALNSVGRALQAPRSVYENLSSLVPVEANIPVDLKTAYETSEKFADAVNESADARLIYDNALLVENQPRGMGTHAAGVVISPTNIYDYSALFQSDGADKPITTMFNKDHIESAGLVKFDLLGLNNLTIIDQTLQLIEKNYGAENKPDLSSIPLNDPSVYDLFRQGKTTAVFQCESGTAKDLEVKMQPSSFDDLTALLALNRPGPLGSGMVNDFIDRKKIVRETGLHKKEWYYHPSLEETLKPTYGMIVYQEQVMRIAQIIAGYSLGQADLLRRAMGKKKPEEMDKQREVFLAGANKNDINPDLASELFDLMAKFADYGFNKSHSAAYALISFQTAWLKTQYPAEYMAATMSNKINDTADIELLIQETKSNCFCPGHGEQGSVEIKMPCVNLSEAGFNAELDPEQGLAKRSRAIRYGLSALAGIGIDPATDIVNERQANGKYLSFADFIARNPSLKKPTIDQMIRAGAFDSLNPSRKELLDNSEKAQKWAKKLTEDYHPSLFEEEKKRYVDLDIPAWTLNSTPTTEEEKMAMERQAFGFYPNESPFTKMEKNAQYLGHKKISELSPKNTDQSFVAQISSVKMVKTRAKGEDMAIVTLSDSTQQIDAVVFPSQYKEYASLVEKGAGVIVTAKIEMDTFQGNAKTKALIHKLESLEERLEIDLSRGTNRAKKHPELHLDLGDDPDLERFERGRQRYTDSTDPTRVFLHYRVRGISMDTELPPEQRMRVSEDLIRSLTSFLGQGKVTHIVDSQDRKIAHSQNVQQSWSYDIEQPHGLKIEVPKATAKFDPKTATYTLTNADLGTKTESLEFKELINQHFFSKIDQNKDQHHLAA